MTPLHSNKFRFTMIFDWFQQCVKRLSPGLVGRAASSSGTFIRARRLNVAHDPLGESLRECCQAESWEQKLGPHIFSLKAMHVLDLEINPQCDESRREAVRNLEQLLKRSDLQ